MSTCDLVLYCETPGAELLVINGDFEVVAKGSHPLSAKVEPGIYALKAKIGSQTSELLQVIDGSQPSYAFTLKTPEFESPMPLKATRTNREYHEGSLGQFTNAGAPFIDLGAGSAIVLYVRDTSRLNFDLPPERKESYAGNFAGFRLLDATGVELLDFDIKATRHIELGYVGANVRVAPGAYILSWKRGNREIRLALNAAPNWGLQVYLGLQSFGPDPLAMRPDFAEAAFAYEAIGAPYSADRPDLRMMEAARLALREKRRALATGAMESLLYGKFENPMLGIYGAHLLASAEQLDTNLFGEVVRNTARLIGQDNPDIVALAWIYASRSDQARVPGFDARPWSEILAGLKGPPLLVASWDALLACAAHAGVDIAKLPVFSVAGDLAIAGIVLTWEHRERVQAQSEVPVGPQGPAKGSIFLQWGKAIWDAVAPALLGKKSDGTPASIPTLDVKTESITTPQAAAEALQLLARKAKWDKWLRLVHKDPSKADSVATFTPLQRDLIATLARATLEPETIEGIDASYIESIMQAHRIPLSTVAGALRALDLVAVSVEVIDRLKAALAAASREQKRIGQG